MTIEIRELVIRAEVKESSGSSSGQPDWQRLKQEVLSSCMAELQKQQRRNKQER